MASKSLGKFYDFCKNAFEVIKKNTRDGIAWAGIDGLANMETAALLVIFLRLFFPIVWAIGVSTALVLGKCIIDEIKGHRNEIHDFVCAVVGVVCGALLLMALL